MEAQREQAKRILDNLKTTKAKLLSNAPEKISTDEARNIQDAVRPLLQFMHDNCDNENLKSEIKDMRAEAAEMQTELKRYLKTSATPERLIKRAPSAIKKILSGDLSSRHIIENTKNEIKAVSNEVPTFHHMGKRR